MNFLKKMFGKSSNEEIEYLKAKLKKAEDILKRISEDDYTKISVDSSLDIWEFLHSEELDKE